VLQRDLNFQAPPRPTITPHKQKRSSPPMRSEKVSPMPENWLLIGATAKPSQFGEMAERPPTAPQKSVKSRPVFPERPWRMLCTRTAQRVQSFGILARENCPASLMATAPQAAARGTSQSKVTFLRNVILLWILVLPRVWTQNRFPLLLATL
jgi:hypothetical protein